MKPLRTTALLFASCLAGAGCFGAAQQQRSYYVLQGSPEDPSMRAPIPGLLRVRTLDVASAYDKFQIVVRKSPFELRYAQADVWAVKPNRMISDIISQSMADLGTFAAVTRELGEVRPDFTIDGDLHAIEVYDSDDLWFAHLSIALRLRSFSTGKVKWTFNFDRRKKIDTRSFSHAARALSELLTIALETAVESMSSFRPLTPIGPTEIPESDAAAPTPPPPEDDVPEPLMVPEPPPPEAPDPE